MDSNMYTQWVQSPIQDSVPNEPNDWPKERPAATNPSSPTLDISEFTTLDLPASGSSSLLSTTTNQSFYPSYGAYYMPQSPYTTMPYGTQWQTSVPLSNYSSLNGATTSSPSQHQSPQQQPATTHLQQHVQLQPVPSTSQHMIIDPALTMNGPSSNSMSPSFSHSPPFSPPPQQQQPQQQQIQPQSQAQQQQRSQFYGQHILSPSPYYRQQPQPPSQGTLSPQALHSPTSSMISLIPSQFYNPHPTQPLVQPSPSQQQQPQQPPPQQQQQPQARQSPSIPGPIASTSQIAPAPVSPVPNPSADERRRQFENSIRPLLQPNAFTGAQAVMQLTHFIVEYGPSEVDAAMRLEILARIRDGAGNQYFRAWSENSTAMDITREWIKASAKSNNAALVETTMPLLHLIDRLPITLQSLRASKLGKIIKKLVKDEPSPAIKDMASNLEQRWRTLLQSDTDGGTKASSASENKGNEDPKVKKRKLSEASSSSSSATNRQPAQPMKKVAVGNASATKPVAVKKEGKPLSSTSSSTTTTTTTTAAAADSSFFSAPKPKAKLPSFKKAPISSSTSLSSSSSLSSQAKEDQPNNVALPSSSNPFQEILAAMNKRDSPSVSTPPSVSANNSSESQQQQQQQQQQPAGLARNGRKKKVVTWAPEDKLESIKLIERAVYDDDPVDGTHVAHSFRDLDRGEGAALHAPPMFEEMADWTEPMLLELPPESTDPSKVRGIQSEEKDTQAEREQTALSAMYLPNQIPDTPTEPGMVLLSEEEVDKDVTQMTAGPEVDAIFWSSDVGVGGEVDQPMPGVGVGAGVAGATPSVADLVGQLAMGLDASSMAAVPQQDAMAAVQNLQSLPPEQLQQLLQQLQFGAMAVYGGAGAAAGGAAAGTGATGAEAHGGAWNAGTGGGNGNQYGMSDYGYHEDNNNTNSSRNWSEGRGGGGRGFGGRGRGAGAGPGRGRGGGYGYGRGGGGGDREEGFRPYIKRKPCSFFAAGRCKYGDQCDFAHDLSMLQQPEH